MRMAGHYVRYPELSTNPLILWEPTHGSANRVCRRLTYVYMLRKDIGITDRPVDPGGPVGGPVVAMPPLRSGRPLKLVLHYVFFI